MKSRIGERVPAKPFWQNLVRQRFEYDAARELEPIRKLGEVTQEGDNLVLWHHNGQQVLTRYRFTPTGPRRGVRDPERGAYTMLEEL